MFSFSSTLRNSSGDSLFSSAIRRIVRSTVVSSTRMPVSLANCVSARSVISRSSTCLSSTSAAGAETFEALSCSSKTRFCSRKSHCVSASSLTTAMTRSSGTTVGPARGPGVCPSTTLTHATALAPTARATNETVIESSAIRFSNPGPDRGYGHAYAASDRWWAHSREHSAAEARAGSFRHARAH